jgi:hypothetical protein
MGVLVWEVWYYRQQGGEKQLEETQMPYNLIPSLSGGGQITAAGAAGLRLELPAGDARSYRLAQMDDYGSKPRRAFAQRDAFSFQVRARSSQAVIPGTWGFGLWNDPFNMGILTGADRIRLPALPNAVWFFFASPPNYLSLRDDLPAVGNLAAVFCAPRIPPLLLALGAPALPLMLLPPAARLLRRAARRVVHQEAVHIDLDPVEWHDYRLDWSPGQARLEVDGSLVLDAKTAPAGPLGFVLWLDNQYAALTPQGRAGFGALAADGPVWIEIDRLEIDSVDRKN